MNLKVIKRRELVLILISGLFLAFHFASWITSLKFTTIASSVVLVTTTPLWVALFSPLFLNEKIKIGIWFGIFFALAGSIIVAFSDVCIFNTTSFLSCPNMMASFHGSNMIGNFLALIGAWMAAGYMIVGRKLRTRLSVTPYVFCVYGAASIILLVIVLIMKMPIIGFSTKAFGWLLLLGLVPQLIGHSSFNWALGYLPAAFVSVALMGEPIGTIILAFIIFAEVPLIGEVIGGVLILTGIIIVSWANHQTMNSNADIRANK